ncbi:hypothetical protein NEFER03_2239 [Nematocida sp. LUAm3]|nr:hypothetical protein NEFER03_2239 [Nematocida sp. LUAm3]KAI5176471.1 hypothetical protein NEFER02_2219 [Nematocida sp. LUAm2]KAI5179357.1 hypothetical protein NEFER01_2195 [Nematocida sp. LUAm1]
MEIFLKKERRKKHTLGCSWTVYVVLLSLVFNTAMCTSGRAGMDAKNNTSRSMMNPKTTIQGFDGTKSAEKEKEKREIAATLIYYFDILPKGSFNYLTTDTLYPKIKHISPAQYVYIDLSGHDMISVLTSPLTFNEAYDLERIIEKIEAIRCRGVCVDSKLSFKVAEMLIERMLVDNEINTSELYSVSNDPHLPNPVNIININRQRILSEVGWKVSKHIRLSIEGCPKNAIESILNMVQNNIIGSLVIKDSSIDVIDLKKHNISEECCVVLVNLLDIKEISLQVEEKEEIEEEKEKKEKVERKEVKKLEVGEKVDEVQFKTSFKEMAQEMLKIIDMYWSDSKEIRKSLYLDRNTFKTLAQAYKKLQNVSVRKVLQVKNLYLDYVPYTFQEVADLSCGLWIQATTVIIRAEYCDECGIQKEDIMIESDFLETFSNIGVECSRFLVARDIIEFKKWELDDEDAYFHRHIKTFLFSPKILSEEFEQCTNHHKKYLIYQFIIHLKNSKEIQKVIEEFQKKRDMETVYIYYKYISIQGYEECEEGVKLIEDIFKCMGQRIKVDLLRFYNIKESIGLDAQKQDSPCLLVPKTKFILKDLQFSNTEEAFIIRILDKYTYSPNATILVEYSGTTKRDIYSLIRKILNHQFFMIYIKNIFNVLEEIQQIDYPFKPTQPNDLTIGKDILQLLLQYPLFFNLLFQGEDHTLSPGYLSQFVEEKEKNKQDQDIFRRRNTVVIQHYLICYSIEEACKNLNGFSQTICSITHLEIFMFSLSTKYFTTFKEVCSLIGLVKDIFVCVKKLTFFNLRVKEEQEEEVLSGLYEFIYTKKKHTLISIALEACVIVDKNNVKVNKARNEYIV